MTITAHPDYQALLAAVIENREDDTPRLIMADWLEDNGEGARAEFIRVQVAVQKTEFICDNRDCNCDYCTLRRRERSLLGDPLCRLCHWHSPVPHGGFSWDFRRGFVAAITCGGDDWLQHAYAITAATPLEKVTWTTFPHWNDMLNFLRQSGQFDQKVNDPNHDFKDPIISWRVFNEQFFPCIKFTLPPEHHIAFGHHRTQAEYDRFQEAALRHDLNAHRLPSPRTMTLAMLGHGHHTQRPQWQTDHSLRRGR